MQATRAEGWSRMHSAVLLSFATTVFVVYLRTMFPSVPGGDSGEMISTACLGAVAHPPGYPLWTLLYMAWIWLFRGFAKPAYLANLLTVVLSTVASSILVLCVRQFVFIALECAPQPVASPQSVLPGRKQKSKPRKDEPVLAQAEANPPSLVHQSSEHRDAMTDIGLWAGVFAAGMYSFCPQIWHYANQAEVFALNNMLCTIILYVAAIYLRRPTLPLACVQAFVCGCALSNQHTSVLFVVPVAITTLLAAFARPSQNNAANRADCAVLSTKGFALMSICALAGLSFYLHLPIAAYRDVLDSWGDHSKLSGFLIHFLRAEYGTFQLASGVGEEQNVSKVLRRMSLFVQWFSRDTLHVGVPLILCGILASCVSRRKELLLLSFCYIFYFVFMNTLSNLTFSELHLQVTARMWQQAHVAGCVLMGVGAASVVSWTQRNFSSAKAIGVGRRRGWVVQSIVLAVLTVQCARWYASMDNSSNYTYYNYGRAVLEPLPDKAVLLLNDDINCNTVQYLLRCETPKPGIQFIRLQLITYNWWKKSQYPLFPQLRFPGTRHHPRDPLGFNMKTFLDENFKHPVLPFYIAGDWKEGDGSQDNYERVPVGLADRVLPPATTLSVNELVAAIDHALPLQYWADESMVNFNRSNVYRGSWDEVIMWKTYSHLTRAAQHLATRESEMPAGSELRRQGLKLAYDMFKSVRKMCGFRNDLFERTDAQLWHNAGVIAGLLATTVGQYDPGYLEYSRDMLEFWRLFVEAAHNNRQHRNHDTRNIEVLLRDQVNPWTGHKLGELLRN